MGKTTEKLDRGAQNSFMDLFPYDPYGEQRVFMEDFNNLISGDFKEGLVGLFEAPTGFGKTVAILSAGLCTGHRIVYLSRTHNQMRQVTEEARRINAKGFNFDCVVKGSRLHLCLDEGIRGLGSNQLAVEACFAHVKTAMGEDLLDLVSKGKVSIVGDIAKVKSGERLICDLMGGLRIVDVAPKDVPEIADVETLLDYGKRKKVCPYFLARALFLERKVAIGSYQYLFLGELGAEEEILVLDEAHNMENVLKGALSRTITSRILERALEETQLGAGASSHKLEESLLRLQRFLEEVKPEGGKSSQIFDKRAMLEVFEDFGITESFMVEFVGSWLEIVDLHADIMRTQRRVFPLEHLRINTVYDFLKSFLEDPPDKYVACIEVEEGRKKLSWICLEPAIGFNQILEQKPHCALLTSGTLSPLEGTAKRLGMGQEGVLKSYDTIIREENVQVIALKRGPNDVELTTKYDRRYEPEIVREYGKTILEISLRVPNGVLVFTPSYRYQEHLLKIWRQEGIFQKIDKNSTIFIERGLTKKVLLETYKKIAKKEKAILFAVCRGTLSEGADFPDEAARAVIMVGVPYASLIDPKITAQREYYERKEKRMGSEWYVDDA
ncbi:MAG: helicase C-terminal domain-containing protein, partial [Candidatus Wukongarchaeota archaeon]|nr:helicase C-terminal domain-containing protein [Candidatus Wukongarchaeota archaeon]